MLINSTFVIRQWTYVVFLALFFLLSYWLCNIQTKNEFYNILFFFTLADPYSFLTYYYHNLPDDWSTADPEIKSEIMSLFVSYLTSRIVLAILIVLCYVFLFFYFWYSSYRNGFNMSCCFYFSKDFWLSISKSK